MAGKRHTTPLFELLGRETTQVHPQRSDAQSAADQPNQSDTDASSEHDPVRDTATPPNEGNPSTVSGSSPASLVASRVPTPPAQMFASYNTTHPKPSTQPDLADGPIRIYAGIVSMPIAWAAVLLAITCAAIIGAWSFGYSRGQQKARADLALRESALGNLTESPGMTQQDAIPVEPVENTGTLVGATTASPASNAQSATQPSDNSTTSQVGPPEFLVNGRAVNADPRLPSHNYLQLSSALRLTDVLEVSRIFADRGMDCFAAMNPKTTRRKDGPLYIVWAGLGFPSGQADSDNAKRYQDQVLAAGATWKEAGGVTDFSDAFWKLYKP